MGFQIRHPCIIKAPEFFCLAGITINKKTHHHPCCSSMSVWPRPKNAENHAKQLSDSKSNLMRKLPREFYHRETTTVAKNLLGHHLVHRSDKMDRIGKIVEVEAYLGQNDLASHSSKGLTKRTAVMFGPPGFAYVYLIYGMYHCFNVVTESAGIGAAVLIRALEPTLNITDRTQGPGLLCNAMMIDRQFNAHDLLSDRLFITDEDFESPQHIMEAPRIGVCYAKEWALKPLRFYIQGNPFVSKS